MCLIIIHNMPVIILYFTTSQGIQAQVLHIKYILQFDDHFLILHPSVDHIPHFVMPGIDIDQLLEIGRSIYQSILISFFHPLIAIHDLHRQIMILIGSLEIL